MAKKQPTYTQRRSRRKKPKKSRSPLLNIVLLLIFVGAIYAYSKCRDNGQDATAEVPSYGTTLERVIIPDETPEILVRYTGFTVSFNKDHHQPNYVVWELTGSEAEGTEPRSSKFRPDPDVLGSAVLEDYRNSGFDRGHMFPAGDAKWDTQAMLDSHYLTNICPQDRKVNSGRWSSLEKLCRQWAQRDSALIIVTGPVLSDYLTRTIGPSHVTVPDRFFKVILAPYADPVRAIGFIVPNTPTSDGLESMATSVDRVEEITGFDFFSALPDDVETVAEQQANMRDWNRRKR